MTPKDDHENGRTATRVVAALAELPYLDEEHLRPRPRLHPRARLLRGHRGSLPLQQQRLRRLDRPPAPRALRRAPARSARREGLRRRAPYAEAALAGESVSFEKELEYADGSRRFVSVSYIPDFDERGRVRGFVALVRDLSERKRAEDSMRFQAHLLDTVEQAVIATDTRRADNLLEPPRREALRLARGRGRRAKHSRSHARREQFVAQATEIMSRARGGRDVDGRVRCAAARRLDLPRAGQRHAHPRRGGALVGVVGVSADITERKAREAAVHEAERRALREYETLLHRLTHLAESLGTARDHLTIFRDLRDFAVVSVPCIGIFISLYDEARDVRVAQYAWGDGEEVDVSTLPPMPVSAEGPNSRAVRTRQGRHHDDYWAMKQKGRGQVRHARRAGQRPQAAVFARRPDGDDGAHRRHHRGSVLREPRLPRRARHGDAMAANLAAVAIENMRLFQFETRRATAAEESNRSRTSSSPRSRTSCARRLTAILGWASMLRDGRLDEKTFRRPSR
jgi:PAS domain-containing protein